jgi:cellulose synthase/poly-beta-1,6-N-acetylglucosamine synthase-like glycosyltransferase
LAVGAHATARPVQAAYLLNPVSNGAPLAMLAAFAFRVKNFVRPLGLRRWGAPCLLTGSGMAFPWRAASRLLALGHLSEDMWWSVELTCAGYAPLFCPEARVYSAAPQRATVMKAQRARWERGHLETMAAGIPKLLCAAFAQRRVEPLWLALELSVPPLALLTLGLCSLFVLTAMASWFGIARGAFLMATLNLIFVCGGVFAAWWKFGREQISSRVLLSAPRYVLAKIPLYVRALFGKRIVWMRTERDAASLNRE